MLYDESTSSSLRPWLVRTLQPICDADPEALADYVLALLKHDAAEPELRKMFVGQLEEFLEKEASKFVDALFATLRSKSYLPYEPVKAEPLSDGIPIPFDALMSSSGPSDRGRKRGLDDGDHDHPPPKGPRLGGDGSFSRYSPTNGRMHGQARGIGHHRGGQINGRGGVGRGDGSQPMNGQMHGGMGNIEGLSGGQTYRPPGSGFPRRRGICRDYHNNGFCARGSLCQYSHGEDAVIPQMPFVNGPGLPNMAGGVMPFMQMFGHGVPFGGMAGGAYDPHESHMEMGPRHGRGSRAPIVPRAAETGTENNTMDVVASSSGELPVIQDLTPRDPVEESIRGELPIQPNGFTHNFGRPRRAQPSPHDNGHVGFVGGMNGGMNGHMGLGGLGGHMGGSEVMGGHIMSGEMGGNMGGGGFQRPGRGSFTGENHSFRSGHRDDKTLVVEKIPEEKLALEAVNEWFKRFGTVTNVAIDSAGGKALVSFSNHTEAHAAWKSEEAVFGNRFVKLFWHRPMEGQGGFGQRALAASASLMRNMGVHESPPQSQPQVRQHASPQPQPSTSTSFKPIQKHDPATVAALAARQQLLERQISEQKVLMSRLSTASTAEEKDEIMARIRSIQSDMKPPTTTQPRPSTSKLPNGSSKDALSEKERLDKELELHQNALQGDGEGVGDEATSTAALKEKLARLKAEASRLGVPETEINAGPAQPSSPYRPYRGRGFRPRGYSRGTPLRGAPRSSMKLDNRPRKLLVQGVPPNDEAVQAVRNHYQNMGNMESFWTEADGDVVAQFWSRGAAEQALASGTEIPSVGQVKVTWHTGAVPATVAPTLTANQSSRQEVKSEVKIEPEVKAEPEEVKAEPEEVKAEPEVKMETEETKAEHEDGGWGQSYDDEDEGRRRRSRSRSSS